MHSFFEGDVMVKQKKCKYIVRALLNCMFTAMLLAGTVVSHAFSPVLPGGSNLGWYNVGIPNGANCRQNYGIIPNYDEPGVRYLVQSQLQAMYSAGQRRLRIPLYHRRSYSDRTVMGSAGGDLSRQDRVNFANFLVDIKNAGFVEMEVSFHPVGENDPVQWDSRGLPWQEGYYQENWNLIVNLRPIIASSGIHYRIDLLNEGAPANNMPRLAQYVERLWTDYNVVFGKSDTIGFSISAGSSGTQRYDNMVRHMNSTGHGLPYLWGVHVYDNPKANLERLSNHQAVRADYRSWVIGETYYDDANTKAAFDQARLGGRAVWHVYQWPLTPARLCADVDVAPPINYRYN